ncbi:MAG TPA: hypothetical protein PLP50_09720 [Thermoanaerobaculia bacterium]|nr:hypothetical protein [Thermoanaerobaculia bacterium]HQN07210.1 hypothetical protein [Thermoanaerobaculia bacterium]
MTGVAVSQKRCPAEIRKPASGSLIAIADHMNQTEKASVRETALIASVRQASAASGKLSAAGRAATARIGRGR